MSYHYICPYLLLQYATRLHVSLKADANLSCRETRSANIKHGAAE
jgi:hypothetical protein